MSGSIRIVDMPDLGAVSDASSVVGERAGSGRFSMTALRDYIYQGGTFTGLLRVPGGVYVTAVGSGNAQFTVVDPSAVVRGSFYWNQSENSVNINNVYAIPQSEMKLNSIGDLHLIGSGNAYKAGGGSWAAVSDARIKTVEGDYTRGLAEVVQLRPVTYRYRPNCGIAATATSYVGLIAQEVTEVLPDMVHTTNGIIDGNPVTDLLALDTNELQFALLNAIKEISARIDALETAAA